MSATITIEPPFVCQPCRGIGRRLQVLGPLDIIYDPCEVCKGRGTHRRIDTIAWMELWRARVGFEWSGRPKSSVRGLVTNKGELRPAAAAYRPGLDAHISHVARGTIGKHRQARA